MSTINPPIELPQTSLWPQPLPVDLPFETAECPWSPSQMVAHRARMTPDAPAVVSNSLMLTYAELDRRANKLANRLIELGVTAETVVALCLDRSAESVIGSL